MMSVSMMMMRRRMRLRRMMTMLGRMKTMRTVILRTMR